MSETGHQRTDDSPVAEHFKNGPHSQAGMVVMAFDQICNQIRESTRIRTLKDLVPPWV